MQGNKERGKLEKRKKEKGKEDIYAGRTAKDAARKEIFMYQAIDAEDRTSSCVTKEQTSETDKFGDMFEKVQR